MSRHVSAYDSFSQPATDDRQTKSAAQNLPIWIQTVAVVLGLVWHQSTLAVIVAVCTAVTVASFHGSTFLSWIRARRLMSTQDRVARQCRPELHDFFLRFLESQNTGRIDCIASVASSINHALFEGIQPGSIAELVRPDLQAIERIRSGADFMVAYQRLTQTVILVASAFVLPLVQRLRSEPWKDQINPSSRQEMNKALAQWDHFLEALDEFQRKLNREGKWNFNSYFGRAGSLV
jgi:hypothetical protein